MNGVQRLAEFGAEHVLNSIPAGLLIAGFVWLLLRILATRSLAIIIITTNAVSADSNFQNSCTRFAIWFSALVAVVALPFVPVLNLGSVASKAGHPKLMLPAFWAVGIAATWALIATLAIMRIAVGLWKLRSLRRNAVAIPMSSLHPALQTTIAEFQATRSVAVSTSRDVRVPTAIGFFHPVILLPQWALHELSTDELKVILLHEFAHLRRWDDWTNLTQKLVRTIFFFHPAVWWIEKHLSLEREMACDDAVLAETRNPRAYAECLVSLAEKSFVRRGLMMAQAVISHARETSLRLAQILDVNRPLAARVSKPALGFVAAFAVFSLAILPGTPRLVAFENPVSVPVLKAAMTPVLPQAMIVPAAAKVVHQTEIGPGYKPANGAEPNTAKQIQNPLAPLIVRAETREIVPAPDFVLVMQTARFDGSYPATVRFAVWRVTYAGPDGNAVRTVIVKQI